MGKVQPAVLPRTHPLRQIDGPGCLDDRRGTNAVNRDQEREEVAEMERRGHAKTNRFTGMRRRNPKPARLNPFIAALCSLV